MELSYQLKLLKDSIEDLKKRKTCLDLASKCKNEIDKINFIDNDFTRGDTGDGEDDTWQEMKFSFLDQYNFDEDDYEFLCFWIEHICLDKERFSKNDSETITEFKKIIPNREEFKKEFKLFIFSFYFEEGDEYKDEIDMIEEDINYEIKTLKMEYPETAIPNLDDLDSCQ